MKKKFQVRHEHRGASTVYQDVKVEELKEDSLKKSSGDKSSTYRPKNRMPFLMPPKTQATTKVIEKKARSNSARKARLNNEERAYQEKKA